MTKKQEWIIYFLFSVVIMLAAYRAECVFCPVPRCNSSAECGPDCDCYVPPGENLGFCYGVE
jgi:hypothetical protein